MAISNLLRVYSETLANQRQQRFAEMQLSLQALQFEADKEFREEQLALNRLSIETDVKQKQEAKSRENAIFALSDARRINDEAGQLDAVSIYQKLLTIPEINKKLNDDMTLKKPEKVVTNLMTQYGYDADNATRIVNIVSSYANEATRPAGQRMARNLSQNISKEYSKWEGSKWNKKFKSGLMGALEKSQIMYSRQVDGVVNTDRRTLSIDPFLGLYESDLLKQNINTEVAEIGMGDYGITRDILPTEMGAEPVSGPVDLVAIDFADSLEEMIGQPQDGLEGVEFEQGVKIQKANAEIQRLGALIVNSKEMKSDLKFMLDEKLITQSAYNEKIKNIDKDSKDALKTVENEKAIRSAAETIRNKIRKERKRKRHIGYPSEAELILSGRRR